MSMISDDAMEVHFGLRLIIIIMDISMVHDPYQDLGHNAPYKNLEKNV